MKLINHQLYYLRESWNLLEMMTLILVMISVGLFHSGKENEGSFRALNVLVGGLIWFVIVTGSLRSTFLPFSVFVSGFTMILLYMIPFGITTFLMLGSFAEMYFKSAFETSVCTEDIDASEFCIYKEAFLKVYVMFVGGIDSSLLTTDTQTGLFWISIFYAFIFSIVMLNVLVAVIFDAWGKVSPHGRLYYWRFRHQFLIETRESKIASRFPMINWLEEHQEKVIESFCNRPERVGTANHRIDKIKGAAFYIMEGLYLGIWFVLGLLSASLLWSKTFRTRIFSLSEEEINGDDCSKERESSSTDNFLAKTMAELEEANRQILVSQQQVKDIMHEFRDLKNVILETQTRHPKQRQVSEYQTNEKDVSPSHNTSPALN